MVLGIFSSRLGLSPLPTDYIILLLHHENVKPLKRRIAIMMNTKNLMAVLALLFLPLAVVAQDDLYFVHKKSDKATVTTQSQKTDDRYLPVQIIYADDDDAAVDVNGSTRDVDEYNRRGQSARGVVVEKADGTFSYQIPGNDTLYIMDDTLAVTTRSLANDVYAQGYNEGYAAGEDYAYTRRLNRFGYAGAYTSPWLYSYYDPFYWDDWYWGYDPYWYGGYYGWYRPYWGYAGWGYGWRGYWGYDPYWYGGYYGWGYPYYGYGWGGYYGNHGRNYRHTSDWYAGSHTARRPGMTGRSAGFGSSGRSTTRYEGNNNNLATRGRTTVGRGTSNSSRSITTTPSTNSRVGSFSNSRSSTPSYTPSTSSSTRSSSFGGSSSGSISSGGRSGGFSGGGGGGGFTGGSRGGGGGRGR